MVMQRRRIPVLDQLFDRMSMLFWPRFKHIFDLNVKSLKSANHRKLGQIDLTPHYVARCVINYADVWCNVDPTSAFSNQKCSVVINIDVNMNVHCDDADATQSLCLPCWH
jgi:hypothetical protein